MKVKIGDVDISDCFKIENDELYINVVDICAIFYNHRTGKDFNNLSDVSKALLEDLFIFSQAVAKNLELNPNVPMSVLKQDQPNDVFTLDEYNVICNTNK